MVLLLERSGGLDFECDEGTGNTNNKQWFLAPSDDNAANPTIDRALVMMLMMVMVTMMIKAVNTAKITAGCCNC